MRTLTLRAVLSCWLTVVLPGALFAADSSAAMLYISGRGKKKRDRNMGGVAAAGGGILDSPPGIYTGLAAIGVLTGWALLRATIR